MMESPQWKTLGKSSGAKQQDYHDLHLQIDVTPLVDMFKVLKTVFTREVRVGPSTPLHPAQNKVGRAVKMTEPDLHLLPYIDMHLLLKNRLKGGILTQSRRYAKERPVQATKRPNNVLPISGQKQSLHGWAMHKPLLMNTFKWREKIPSAGVVVGEKNEREKAGYCRFKWGTRKSFIIHTTHTRLRRTKIAWRRNGTKL